VRVFLYADRRSFQREQLGVAEEIFLPLELAFTLARAARSLDSRYASGAF